jgi:hypothetical protein
MALDLTVRAGAIVRINNLNTGDFISIKNPKAHGVVLSIEAPRDKYEIFREEEFDVETFRRIVLSFFKDKNFLNLAFFLKNLLTKTPGLIIDQDLAALVKTHCSDLVTIKWGEVHVIAN